MVEYGVARFVLPGQSESGDRHLVCCGQNEILIAAIDGIGHGKEAADAAETATAILKGGVGAPIISLVQRCHDKLRSTRGVVLSLASIDPVHGMMTWLGVGNVQGVLLRSSGTNGVLQETLLLRGGVVGSQLPPLQAAVLPVAQGDTLFFATDGIRSDFSLALSVLQNPQRAADRILQQCRMGTDDALIVVSRLTGVHP